MSELNMKNYARIHFIWFSNLPLDQMKKNCLEQYANFNIGYEITIWTHSSHKDWHDDETASFLKRINIVVKCLDVEEKYKKFFEPQLFQIYKRYNAIVKALEEKKYASASDILRVIILYYEQGFYTEFDQIPLKSFDTFLNFYREKSERFQMSWFVNQCHKSASNSLLFYENNYPVYDFDPKILFLITMAYYIDGPNEPSDNFLKCIQGSGTGMGLADYVGYLMNFALMRRELREHRERLLIITQRLYHDHKNGLQNFIRHIGEDPYEITDVERDYIVNNAHRPGQIIRTIQHVRPFLDDIESNNGTHLELSTVIRQRPNERVYYLALCAGAGVGAGVGAGAVIGLGIVELTAVASTALAASVVTGGAVIAGILAALLVYHYLYKKSQSSSTSRTFSPREDRGHSPFGRGSLPVYS